MKFAELDKLPLVLPSAPSAVRRVLDQLAHRFHITLNIVMEADSTPIQRAVAIRGEAYVVLPLHVFSEELAAGTVHASRIVEPSIDRIIAMGITSVHPTTQATREVAKAIRNLLTGRFNAISNLP